MGKIGLAITGVAAAAILSTVALTDKHAEPHRTEAVENVYHTYDIREPIGVIQYDDFGTEFEYPSAADAAFVPEIPEADVMNALIMGTYIDGYRFRYKFE